MSINTLNSNLTNAAICRNNGWGVGTVLEGEEGYGPTRIRITAIGESAILAVAISHKGNPLAGDEGLWTLSCREWHEVTK